MATNESSRIEEGMPRGSCGLGPIAAPMHHVAAKIQWWRRPLFGDDHMVGQFRQCQWGVLARLYREDSGAKREGRLGHGQGMPRALVRGLRLMGSGSQPRQAAHTPLATLRRDKSQLTSVSRPWRSSLPTS